MSAAPPLPGGSRPALVLAALRIPVFSVASQVMLVPPILPRIPRELRIPAFHLALPGAAYSAAVAVVALCMGPVSDRLGRRRMLPGGAALMIAAPERLTPPCNAAG